jgi:hypothetical protein
VSETDLLVQVNNPSINDDFVVVTELSAMSGTIADPFAREATFRCAHDLSGPVEVCVNATYSDGTEAASDDPNIGASLEYLRTPHVRLPDLLECSETRCMMVTCPEVKNECPVVSSLTGEPQVVPEEGPDAGKATITVVADDPDDNPPDALVTTLEASAGTIDDVNASQTTFTCDSNVGGAVVISVVASDGDSVCDDDASTWVRCPGEPTENTCPIVEDLTATPMKIEEGDATTIIRVTAVDPDEFPDPLRTQLSAAPSGSFDDRFASETTFTCGESGLAEICVDASDGDTTCMDDPGYEPTCIFVECPSDIPLNLCPMLFVINTFPSMIPEGQNWTNVETRGQDTDGVPVPLELTLHALWGSFENTINIPELHNVVAQNATYVCSRPGRVELCVDATDGACMKTRCTNVTCPDDVPTAP